MKNIKYIKLMNKNIFLIINIKNKEHDVFIFAENKIENIAFPIILKNFSSYFINEADLEKI